MSSARPPEPARGRVHEHRSGRALWAVVGLLAAAAIVLWVGALRGGGAAQSALAVLALGMIAAVLATGGLPRRLLGALLAAVAAVATAGVLAAIAGPAGAALPAVLGVTAGALLLAAGVLLATLGHRMPRMGSRYRSPNRRSRRSLWDEMDAGRDPTC